jgi:hypothetical protein
LATLRLLGIRAQSEVEAGRTGEARELVRDMLALSEIYRREPMLIAQLVRLASVELTRDTVDQCVKEDAAEADLRAWLDVVPGPDHVGDSIDLGFQGELACVAQLGGSPLEMLKAAGREQEANGGFLTAPYFKITSARYLRSMVSMIRASRKPYLEARRETEAMINELRVKRSPLDLFAILLVPALSRSLDNQMNVRASLAVTRAGLEAEIRRASAGAYPERIDAIDPFTGKPLLFDGSAITSAGIPDKVGEEKPAWKLRKK